MSRNTLKTLFLIIVSLLLAVALFIAGAIWRGRATARSTVTDSRKSVVALKLVESGRKDFGPSVRLQPGWDCCKNPSRSSPSITRHE